MIEDIPPRHIHAHIQCSYNDRNNGDKKTRQNTLRVFRINDSVVTMVIRALVCAQVTNEVHVAATKNGYVTLKRGVLRTSNHKFNMLPFMQVCLTQVVHDCQHLTNTILHNSVIQHTYHHRNYVKRSDVTR